MTWVRIKSWHIFREGFQTSGPLLCGKRASAHRDPRNRLDHQAQGWRPDPPPMDEPTCEVCLRILAIKKEET